MPLVLNKVPFPHKYILEVRLSWHYWVTKGNIFFVVLLSLFSRDVSLSLKLTSKRCFSENLFGFPLFSRRILKLCMFLLNVNCDEFVLRRHNTYPFMHPFLRLLDDTNKN